jgi:hypothetical protein
LGTRVHSLIVNKTSLSLSPETVWPSCALPKGVPQGQTESGGIVLAVICWSPSAQRRCALSLPTLSHSLIVNKLFSLSLSLARSHSLSPSHTETRGRERKDRERAALGTVPRNPLGSSEENCAVPLDAVLKVFFLAKNENKVEKRLFRKK